MKIITVQFEDSVDISAVAVGAAASVSGVATPGVVMLVGAMENPPDLTQFASKTHTHPFDAPPGVTGPAIATP